MVFGCFFKDRLYESVFGGMEKRTAFCFKTQKKHGWTSSKGRLHIVLFEVGGDGCCDSLLSNEYHRFGDFLSGFYHVWRFRVLVINIPRAIFLEWFRLPKILEQFCECFTSSSFPLKNTRRIHHKHESHDSQKVVSALDSLEKHQPGQTAVCGSLISIHSKTPKNRYIQLPYKKW